MELAQAGVPEKALAAVDPLVRDAHLNGSCLCAIADVNGLRLVEHGAEVPPEDMAMWAPVPHLLPILAWRQAQPPYVMVLADRIGADFVTVVRGQPETRSDAGGATDPVRKVAPGGWSQRRYQQRAENTWEHNATDVARELEALVDRCRARLVLVAGDVRARQLLRDNLPSEILRRVVEITGSRSEDGSAEITAAETANAVARAVEEDNAALVAKFEEERGQRDRAADGIEETLAALRSAQAEVLLVSDAFDRAARGWCGPEAVHVASNPDQLRALGVEEPSEAPLVDVLVRAALGTSAGIRIVPQGSAPTEGVGAILRWTD